jgi:hypothetical protein
MESAIRPNIVLGKVLIVAKEWLPSIQPKLQIHSKKRTMQQSLKTGNRLLR